MDGDYLQQQCELGQQQLMQTAYLDAIQTLTAAEQLAWDAKDFDTLSRLYMPLQEAHRQARQRCGEGTIALDLIQSSDQPFDVPALLDQYPHGQFLVAGQASLEPALAFRRLARQRKLYAETFLAAAFPLIGPAQAIAIVPLEDIRLPSREPRTIDALLPQLPAHSLCFSPNQLPNGARPGTTETYAHTMSLWEQLHRPFLAAADMLIDPLQKMSAYRTTLRVDPACELAHQNLANVAKQMTRV